MSNTLQSTHGCAYYLAAYDFPERITDKEVSHNNELNRVAQDKSNMKTTTW